jgi:thiol-disulfide isomerase/thioredoxin
MPITYISDNFPNFQPSKITTMRIKIALIALLIVPIVYLIIKPVELVIYGILNGWGWTFSSFSHWILIIGLSVLIAILLPFKSTNWKTVLVRILVPLLFGGIYFARNPIYQGDYSKRGTDVEITDNSLLNEILQEEPNFDGVVCIAAVWCPFCKEATRQRLKIMKKRKPELQIAIYLADKDSTAVDRFIEETGADDLSYFQVKDSSGMIALSGGAYPTFAYIKDKKIIHIWRNDEMGYPTLDWIENKLK